MNVRDTILTVPTKPGMPFIACHPKSKDKARLSDGRRHPVRVLKEARKGNK